MSQDLVATIDLASAEIWPRTTTGATSETVLRRIPATLPRGTSSGGGVVRWISSGAPRGFA